MPALVGIALSLAGALFAFARMRAPAASPYAHAVYHMTARSHRRFAVASVAFAAAFGLGLRLAALVYPLLAVYVLLLVLYGSSFARGFSGEDE